MRALVPNVSLELSRFRRDDGRARHHRIPFYDSALGAAVRAGVRAALRSLCAARAFILEVDETAVPVRSGAHYLYRAVDKHGKTVDSLICVDRSESAARAFFNKALKTHQPRRPRKQVTERCACYGKRIPSGAPSWCEVTGI
jgi:transposase-like protein